MNFSLILVFIIFIVIAESISQHYIKKGSIYSELKYLFIAFLFYIFVVYFLYQLYKKYKMGPIFLLWSVLSTLSVYLIGHFIYKEKITINDIIGSVLCFTGLYLVYQKSQIH